MGNSSSSRRSRRSPPSEDNAEERQKRAIRKLILDGKLAPMVKGGDDGPEGTEECPICFLDFRQYNRTTCCHGVICTNCFLQLQSSQPSPHCPFCNGSSLNVTYEPSTTPLGSAEAATGNRPRAETTPTKMSVEDFYRKSPLSTTDDRKRLEDEIRHARSYTSYTLSSSIQTNNPGRRSTPTRRNRESGGSGTGGAARRQLNFAAELDDIFGIRGLQDLQRLEEFMLMEAIQQSMMDTPQQQSSSTMDAAPAQHQPAQEIAESASTTSRRTSSAEGFDASENQMLAAAMALSMGGGSSSSGGGAVDSGDTSTTAESEPQGQEVPAVAEPAKESAPAPGLASKMEFEPPPERCQAEEVDSKSDGEVLAEFPLLGEARQTEQSK